MPCAEWYTSVDWLSTCVSAGDAREAGIITSSRSMRPATALGVSDRFTVSSTASPDKPCGVTGE
eukprot:8347481-Pyramimonas_sp.AAC.1